MYILLVGTPPFIGEDEDEVFSKILKEDVNLNINELTNISENCKDLIKKLLEKDAHKRIKAVQALKHPFFTTGISIGNLFKGKYKENNEVLKTLYRSKTLELQAKKTSKFKEMVIAYISLNFSEEDEETKAKKIFMEMAGGDNHFLIRKNTFVQRMNSIYKGKQSSEDIEKLFDSLDENKSGNLEYEELIRALSDQNKLLSDKNLNEAFEFFDQDNSGSISWNEIANVIYPNGKIDKDTMKEFMEEIGQKDENKEISFEEFKNILRN
jgi:calcium-dependent protein kinase